MPTSITVSAGDTTIVHGIALTLLWVRGKRARFRVTPPREPPYEVETDTEPIDGTPIASDGEEV